MHALIDSPQEPTIGPTLLVLLHGRGSDERDLTDVRPGLPPDVILVTPRAPFPGAAWGYGDGWAWYRFLGETTPDPSSFEQSQIALATFLAELPARLPVAPGAIVLGGFSQGGTTALGYALRNPGAVDGLLMFSGFLPTHPSVSVTPESVAGLRVFWGHGTLDPMIPHQRGVDGRSALVRAGAEVLARDYPIGHGIDPAELKDAADWLATFQTTTDGAG